MSLQGSELSRAQASAPEAEAGNYWLPQTQWSVDELFVNLQQVCEYRVGVTLDGEHFCARCNYVGGDGTAGINRTRERAYAILNGGHRIDWCFARGLANA